MDADTYYTPIIPELSRSNTCKLYEINHGPPTHFNNLLTPTEDSKAMDNKSTYNLRPKTPPNLLPSHHHCPVHKMLQDPVEVTFGSRYVS